jgi:anti-anti-sigma factor
LPDTAVPALGATAVGSRWFSGRRSDCVSTIRLSVSGELDIARAPQLEDALGCAQADAALVMLDLRELEFMHSSPAHLVEAARATPSKWSGALRLSALTANPSSSIIHKRLRRLPSGTGG